MSKNTNPKWQLTDEWGLGLDSMNWKLYRRNPLKTEDGYTYWRVDSYYPTLFFLIRGLQNNIILTESDSPSFREHLDDAIEAATEALKALDKQRKALGVGIDTLPPKYAEYRQTEKGGKKEI